MQITDSHIHLQRILPISSNAAEFESESAGFFAQLRHLGVNRFFCNGTRPDDWDAVLALARHHAEVFPCLGLHPWFVGASAEGASTENEWAKGEAGFATIDTALERLEHLLDAAAVVPLGGSLCGYRIAVGEIGLDRALRVPAGTVPAGTARAERDALQEYAFIKQLAIANRRALPVMLHCVHATGRMLDHLRAHAESVPILLHGFTGAVESIPEWVELGTFFSFSARIFQAGRQRGPDILRAVPLDRILVETDAPDRAARLSVVESIADLPRLIDRIAEHRSVLHAAMRRQIVENTERFLERWRTSEQVNE